MVDPVDASPESQSQKLCLPFVARLPIDGASISVLATSGRRVSLGASDAIAARIDELQFELGEGPQWESFRSGTRILLPDTLGVVHAAWPLFGTALAELDVAALFTFPLVMGAVSVGAVSLHRSTPGDMVDRDLIFAAEMAVAVTGLAVNLALRSANGDAAPESPLSPAMRREVHQATGMMVVQLETTATNAYSRLQGHAFSTGRTVQEVAHEVVTRTLRFTPSPDSSPN